MNQKIILSRKGFDSTAGGVASPVINGKFFSLPIPEKKSGLEFKKLKLFGDEMDLSSLLKHLNYKQGNECHMDPNLSPSIYGLTEDDGWSPAFGQHKAASTHLIKTNEVDVGDVFLFFGRYRHAKQNGNKIEYLIEKDFHAIFGFLEIGDIKNIKTKLNGEQRKKYLNHPHVKNPEYYSDNSTLFIPAEKSKHGFKKTYGTFKFHTDLVLSENGKSISNWKLPEVFWNMNFTYNLKVDKKGISKSPCRGQEMVGTANEETIDWIKKTIESKSI